MIIDPVSAAAGGYVAKEAIRGLLGKSLEFIYRKYKLSKVDQIKERYIEYCENLLNIKTLAFQDRSVFIDDIFVPLNLKGVNTLSVTVTDTTNLDFEGRAVIIKGLAGMGKSTILRKLLANNARSRERLPIFYELKNYRGGALEDALSKNLINAGVQISKEQLEAILGDSNVKLYLDAFDETPPEYREQLLDEIGRVINMYNCNLVCTTRPDTEIDSLVNVETFNVDVLSQEQIFAIIEKTSADSEKAESLCEALKRSPLHRDSESILKSPILVVLFCVSYNLGEEIPSTLSQFYANIFDTIFHRHDNLKGKVNRVRHWNDNRRIYKSLFEYLCFISQRSGMSNFSRDKLVEFVANSLAYMNEDQILADKITTELASITNLIIEDGFNEYRFIHKSIQEFFSSAFVCTLPQEKKQGFYTLCINNFTFHNLFENTLFFLEEIDYYDHAEYFLVPAVSEILSLNGSMITDKFIPSNDLINRFLSAVVLHGKRTENYDEKFKLSGVEEEIYSPFVKDGFIKTIAEFRLFQLVSQSIINLESQKDEILRFVIGKGHDVAYGIKMTTFEEIFIALKISREIAQNALLVGVGLLYREKYNNAVSNLNNRKQQITNQGYLDF